MPPSSLATSSACPIPTFFEHLEKLGLKTCQHPFSLCRISWEPVMNIPCRVHGMVHAQWMPLISSGISSL